MCDRVPRSLVYVFVYSNWNVQAIKTNEVNYYCVFSATAFVTLLCIIFLLFGFVIFVCRRLVFSPHVQSTCLFRDVHYSPSDDVYRVLAKHKLSRHDVTKKKALAQMKKRKFNITYNICVDRTTRYNHLR